MSRPSFHGTWRNTDVTSESVVALAFEPEQGRVHAWSGRPEARIDLGSGPIETFGGIADPSAALAFTARLPGAGAGEVVLQGNINRGLMILATYHWASGDAALAGRFSREFLARREPGFVAIASSSTRLAASSSTSKSDPDTHEFVGHWLDASDEGDLRSLEIRSAGSRLSLAVRGSGRRLPAVWPTGETWLFGYHDEAGHDTLLLLGRFELPEGRSDLQIKVASGTAVVASFHTRNDGRSWFTREFLRRR